MIKSEDISALISEWGGKEKTFSEFIANLFKDKYVEIYVGDSYEEVKFEQSSTSYPAVFCGKIIGAFKECIVLEALHVSKHKVVKSGSILFLNERAIRALSEIDGASVMSDMILSSIETNSIFDAFINNKTLKK